MQWRLCCWLRPTPTSATPSPGQQCSRRLPMATLKLCYAWCSMALPGGTRLTATSSRLCAANPPSSEPPAAELLHPPPPHPHSCRPECVFINPDLCPCTMPLQLELQLLQIPPPPLPHLLLLPAFAPFAPEQITPSRPPPPTHTHVMLSPLPNLTPVLL